MLKIWLLVDGVNVKRRLYLIASVKKVFRICNLKNGVKEFDKLCFLMLVYRSSDSSQSQSIFLQQLSELADPKNALRVLSQKN